MNKRGYLAPSYLDIVCALGFVFVTGFFFLVYSVALEEPETIPTQTLALDAVTLHALLDYPVGETELDDFLVTQFEKLGPGAGTRYQLLSEHIGEALSDPTQYWEVTILSLDNEQLVRLSKSGYQVRAASPEERVSIAHDLKRPYVYLPTDHRAYPVVKVTLLHVPGVRKPEY